MPKRVHKHFAWQDKTKRTRRNLMCWTGAVINKIKAEPSLGNERRARSGCGAVCGKGWVIWLFMLMVV